MKNEELDLIIEKAMKTGPDFHLPIDFAQKAALKFTHSFQWKNDLLEYLYMTGLIFALVTVGAGLYYYIDKALVLNILSIVAQNSIQFILVFLLLNFILFADKVLLPLLFNRWKRI